MRYGNRVGEKMAVDLYSGTPGSGKSLHVTRNILLNLWAGKDVISNYPIKFKKKEIKKGYEDRFYYVKTEDLTVDKLMKFAHIQGYIKKRKENQCLVVIDEAGGRFNVDSDKNEKNALEDFFSDSNKGVQVKEFGRKDRMIWKKFFSQHRKYGFDFILIAQDDRMLDRQIRAMIEKEYKHRKAQNIKWWFRLFPLKLFISIEYYYQMKLKTDYEFFFFTKNIGNRYDHMKLFDEFDITDFANLGPNARAIFTNE